MFLNTVNDLQHFACPSAHCHSKDEVVRQIAAQGCRYLAHQCSDTDAVEKLVKHFFEVLNGLLILSVNVLISQQQIDTIR